MTAQPMMATMMTSAATTAIIWFWDMCLPLTVQLRPSIGKGKGRREAGPPLSKLSITLVMSATGGLTVGLLV
jgi:hypothetical protein